MSLSQKMSPNMSKRLLAELDPEALGLPPEVASDAMPEVGQDNQALIDAQQPPESVNPQETITPVPPGNEIPVAPQVTSPYEPGSARDELWKKASQSINNKGPSEALLAQQRAIPQAEEEVNNRLSGLNGVDISPLMALSDAWFGGNLSKNYKNPNEAASQRLAIRKTLQEMRGKLTENQAKELNANMGGGRNSPLAQAARGEQTQDAAKSRTVQVANAEWDKVTAQDIPRLEGATRIHDLWRDIDNGKVKNNGAAKSLIVAEVQRLETGASNPAYEGQARKEMHTAAESLGELAQKLSGNPQDSVPEGVKQQLKALTNSLTGSYKDALTTKYLSLLSAAQVPGVPYGDLKASQIQARYNSAKEQYGKRLGGWEEGKSPSVAKPKKSEKSSASQKPKTVIQNGHTYNLNEKTGQYE